MDFIAIQLGALQENCYICFDADKKKGVIIDPGMEDEQIDRAIEENKLDIIGILLTHGHFDHIGGVDAYKKKYDTLVYAHTNEAAIAKNTQLNGAAHFARKPLEVSVDIKLVNGDEIPIGGGRLKTLHTPGHTTGSVCYHDEEGCLLFSGDTLFYESVGRFDFATGDRDELMSSIIHKLLVLPSETKVLPGHMQPTTIFHESENNPFIDEE